MFVLHMLSLPAAVRNLGMAQAYHCIKMSFTVHWGATIDQNHHTVCQNDKVLQKVSTKIPVGQISTKLKWRRSCWSLIGTTVYVRGIISAVTHSQITIKESCLNHTCLNSPHPPQNQLTVSTATGHGCPHLSPGCKLHSSMRRKSYPWRRDAAVCQDLARSRRRLLGQSTAPGTQRPVQQRVGHATPDPSTQQELTSPSRPVTVTAHALTRLNCGRTSTTRVCSAGTTIPLQQLLLFPPKKHDLCSITVLICLVPVL